MQALAEQPACSYFRCLTGSPPTGPVPFSHPFMTNPLYEISFNLKL